MPYLPLSLAKSLCRTAELFCPENVSGYGVWRYRTGVAEGIFMQKEEKLHTAAVVLAAGSGKRMNTGTKKQYMEILGKPVLYYSLKAFQESFVDEVILVVAEDEITQAKENYVNQYGFDKVTGIVAGGKERYHSVACGLRAVSSSCDYVFIHDSARPMINGDILERAYTAVKQDQACVVGMVSKDTVKLADENGFVAMTPKRSLVWNVQTPQVFAYGLVREAYEELLVREQELLSQGIQITDDAMVVELMKQYPVRLVEGSYENIKITTPEDISVAEAYLAGK